MRYRRLGRTELMVSEIGFGGGPIGGDRWGGVDDENSLAALQRAFDLGVNFFDTGDVYGRGHSEELIGQALGEVRSRVLIATKCSLDVSRGASARADFSPRYIERALEASLRRLRTSYIDLYQLHDPPQELAGEDSVWETLARLREAGTIRYFGVSCRTVDAAAAYLGAAEAAGDPGRFGDTLQVPYNLLDQAAAVKGVFVEAHRQDWGVISRVPLAAGLLSGKYSAACGFSADDFRSEWPADHLAEVLRRVEACRFLERPGRPLVQAAVAFVLSQPPVSTVITGARTAEQVAETAAAGDHAPLSADELRAAAELYATDFRAGG